MQQMDKEIKQRTAITEDGEAGEALELKPLEMSDVVPVAGLILGQFHIQLTEHRFDYILFFFLFLFLFVFLFGIMISIIVIIIIFFF